MQQMSSKLIKAVEKKVRSVIAREIVEWNLALAEVKERKEAERKANEPRRMGFHL